MLLKTPTALDQEEYSEMIRICSWCKKLLDLKWLKWGRKNNSSCSLTHGICDECSDQVLEENNKSKLGAAFRLIKRNKSR